jgi:rRNA maturation protein Nop10
VGLIVKSKLVKCIECGRYAINDEAVFKSKTKDNNEDAIESENTSNKEHLVVINFQGMSKRKDIIPEKEYNICPECQGKMLSVLPPKFGMEDKYQKYRIDAFKEKIKKKFDYLFQKSN